MAASSYRHVKKVENLFVGSRCKESEDASCWLPLLPSKCTSKQKFVALPEHNHRLPLYGSKQLSPRQESWEPADCCCKVMLVVDFCGHQYCENTKICCLAWPQPTLGRTKSIKKQQGKRIYVVNEANTHFSLWWSTPTLIVTWFGRCRFWEEPPKLENDRHVDYTRTSGSEPDIFETKLWPGTIGSKTYYCTLMTWLPENWEGGH